MKTVLETDDGRVWIVRVVGPDGSPVAEQRTITVGTLCRGIRRSRRQVYRYFRRGIIKPVGKFLGEWLVDEQSALAWSQPAARSARIPKSSRPLFPEFALDTLHAARHAGIVIHRLLEEGNRDELSWLFGSYGRSAVAEWIRREGWRLSPRAARFWSWWLDVRSVAERPSGDEGPSSRRGAATGDGVKAGARA